MQRRPSPRTVLAIASLGGAVAFIDATIVNIALPDIAHSFPGTSISTLSWILNAYNIVFAAFLVAAGRIADLLGCGREEIVRVGERARAKAAEFAVETVAQRYLEDFASLLALARGPDEMSDLSLTND